MKELAGRVAVITGGAGGVGQALAQRLAAEDMRVVIADVFPEQLDQAVAELRDAGHDVTGVVTDVSDFASVERLRDAAYATYGAAKALGFGVAPVPAFAMGVMTACAGGIIRDLLAGEPSILMRPELYVTAAALAAGLFVGLTLVGVTMPFAAAVAAIAGFALRGAAIARGWSLPAYRD